jgi:hypothetical protein
MSPSAGDVAQTPESKPTSGFASVFKNLTSSRSTKSLNPQSPASVAQQLSEASSRQSAIYGGPPNYEQLYGQLKAGNSLADRLSAAESFRHAVQDYPLSGVRQINQLIKSKVFVVGDFADESIGDKHIQARKGFD